MSAELDEMLSGWQDWPLEDKRMLLKALRKNVERLQRQADEAAEAGAKDAGELDSPPQRYGWPVP